MFRLIALNLGWTDPGLNTEALDALMSCLPPNLSQLNISGCRQAFFDRRESLNSSCFCFPLNLWSVRRFGVSFVFLSQMFPKL